MSETDAIVTAGQKRALLQRLLMPWWTLVFPLLGLLAIAISLYKMGAAGTIAAAFILIGCVLAAVHQAEVVAHRVGEPFGTLVLAVAVTVIEVSLIVSLMLSDAGDASSLARDTVFAAIMIILNGIVGVCLLAGGARHGEQRFSLRGASSSLNVLTAMVVLSLVLPNYVSSAPGPTYAPSQLIFVAIVSVILYGTFVMVQTVRHRDYFLPADEDMPGDAHAEPPTNAAALAALGMLLVALIGVVLLAKGLSGIVEAAILGAGLPLAIVGVVIAALVLAPESLAAYRAARRNRLQTSLNLALGSALATIGLTIPAVAIVSLALGLPLALGIGAKQMILLVLSLFTITLTLGNGRTTVLGGAVHLVIFAAYLFVTVVP
ncbi:ionic transporter y4hA [Sphingomonas paucimobilis]|jgi:Ca2+:H+ antiporter|uniref:Ionic transporter y4hA n=3 Tax=Pseudomonadota TaxID=1224 RepID=A0A411LMQ8_SPHPI|nr:MULTISPECIES: ionic transporter y4hA [Sphingomonas]MBQ1478461.1 ionic transporter y4hA [Sphingomonas sp.]MCM3679693.1 ionic transporter y4hA [Sphingomonas paucimobilis]MDG5970913.1 ionic transporter y4hA [Sphingomonas paucimobilis]NNG58401.1 ionic transporter y4hA [Sphingomonas paucimobilis]QBE93638.1 ionic transporter y4hA [Sphingomonas paucimobilis]